MNSVVTKTKRNKYHYLYYVADFVISFCIIMFSFMTHFWSKIAVGELSQIDSIIMFSYSAGVALATVICFIIFKVYKVLTRDFSFTDAISISLITFLVNLAGLIIMIVLKKAFPAFSRPAAFSWVLSTICLCGILPTLRLSSRFFRLVSNTFSKKDTINTIVIGAGALGKMVIEDSRSSVFNKNKVVAIVDDDVTKFGSYMYHLPIVGPITDIAKFVEQYNAKEVIIAINNYPEEKIKEIAKNLINLPVRLRKVNSLSTTKGANDKNVFDVDINELLFRSSVEFDNTDIKQFINNKTVLVTGAGGSIGSELVRQIFAAKPKCIILFDIYENSTYEIEQELKQKLRKDDSLSVAIKTVIGSTYNLRSIEKVIRKYEPNLIFHAAAYKHVPLMEKVPEEAIRTNVIGTYNVAMLADKYKVSKMILVSTDKAVRPTNAMGATKRFAETIIQYFASKSKNTAYAAVRFGNVLGSNGSVIPLFKKQIEMGGPVTITDKEMIRYFMTIPEAVGLILQCSLFAKDGEIFILDMGEPVKIIDLAERMIKQAGLIPYTDIDIITIGLRPGEKLYEELLLDKTRQTKTPNSKIFIEPPEKIYPIEEEIKMISKAFELDHKKEIKELLKSIITTYTPDER